MPLLLIPSWTPAGLGPAMTPGGGMNWGGDTFRYFTKPRQTIQSPERLYKAPEKYTKPRVTIQRPQNLRPKLDILNKYLKY